MMASTALLMDDKPAAAPQQAEHLKCPRCDSSNTKFCYYNNYSLSQPRHFCKSCKRYWTRGGTLRNVPVGGGCRKNKRLRRPSSAVDSTTAPSSNSSSAVVAPTSTPHQIDLNPIFYGLPTTAPQFPFSARYNHDLATEAGNYHDQLNHSVSGLGFSSGATPTIASLLASTFHSHNKTTPPSSSRLESFQALSTPGYNQEEADQRSRECSSGINDVKGEGQQYWGNIINMSGCQNPMEQQIGLSSDPFLFWNTAAAASQFGLL